MFFEEMLFSEKSLLLIMKLISTPISPHKKATTIPTVTDFFGICRCCMRVKCNLVKVGKMSLRSKTEEILKGKGKILFKN